MDRLAHNPEKRKGLQTIFACLVVALIVMMAISAVIYFVNGDKELMSDTVPAMPTDGKH